MDNNSMYNELDSMKAQMNLLKEKLERQEIVKEQHLRKAIKGKLDEEFLHPYRPPAAPNP